MYKTFTIVLTALFVVLVYGLCPAQETVTIIPTDSEAAEGLDLGAVSELFKSSENLEEFEHKLNDPEVGVNNLDLDDNGDVEYIRVVEEVVDETHVIILQALLGENQSQDVATIEVEKDERGEYQMQMHGNEVIYGYDYYVAPAVVDVHIHTWPIITWMYRPLYRPYRSVFYFGFYPRWWHPWRPVAFHVYRARPFVRTTHFHVTNVTVVRNVHKVNYTATSSTLVRKKTRVQVGGEGTGSQATVKKTGVKTVDTETGETKARGEVEKEVTNPETGQTGTVKKVGEKTTDPETGETTVRGKVEKEVTNPETGETHSVKKVGEKTTDPETGETTAHGKVKKEHENPETGQSTEVKKAGKKETNKQTGETSTVKKGSKKTENTEKGTKTVKKGSKKTQKNK